MMMKHSIEMLLIDDDEDYAFLVGELVRHFSTPVTLKVAASGKEIELALADPTFDIALVDNRLGEAIGVDVIAGARRRGITAPMILFSGVSSIEAQERALAAGASGYAVKGELNVQEFEALILGALDNSAFSRPG